MSCVECNGQCCGKTGFNKYGLDVDVGYRSSDCKIDDQQSWWVVVSIDSNRGCRRGHTSIVSVEGDLSAGPEIDVLSGSDSAKIPGNSTGGLLEFNSPLHVFKISADPTPMSPLLLYKSYHQCTDIATDAQLILKMQ